MRFSRSALLILLAFCGLGAGCAASVTAVIPVRDDVTDKLLTQEIKESEVPVLVLVGATWCDPCVDMHRQIEAVAPDYEGWVRFVSINADTSVSVANALGISRVPTVLLFDGGREVQRRAGFIDDDELKTILDSSLGL
ncbi:MAG TPA: thioredoxin family protein [Myxococcota bacterium]|nr:thioredoxin family protein [Myxococcota bacterium]